MSSPRVWSRDDFLQAAEICRVARQGSHEEDRDWHRRQTGYVCAVLEFAERNAVLQIAQPRDEHGRFAAKPSLRLDSAIVTSARAESA